MAIKTRADIITAIATLVADNTTGDVSAEDIRSLLSDLNDSCVNKTTDTASTGLSAYDTSRVYYLGNIVQYDYKWYVANTTTTAGAFNASHWNLQGYVNYSGSLTIETASVLTLNTTPLTLISAIASKYIKITESSAKLTYNSIEYTTNTGLEIYTEGGATVQHNYSAFLAGTASKRSSGNAVAGGSLISNAAIKVRVPTGNPAAGNSQIIVYFTYIVVD